MCCNLEMSHYTYRPHFYSRKWSFAFTTTINSKLKWEEKEPLGKLYPSKYPYQSKIHADARNLAHNNSISWCDWAENCACECFISKEGRESSPGKFSDKRLELLGFISSGEGPAHVAGSISDIWTDAARSPLLLVGQRLDDERHDCSRQQKRGLQRHECFFFFIKHFLEVS